MIWMIGQRYGKIKDGQTAAHQHRAKGFVAVAEIMGNAYQDAAAKDPDTYTAGGSDPFIVDGIFYKESDGEHQHANTNLADEVFADEFFQVWMFFEKALGSCVAGAGGGAAMP